MGGENKDLHVLFLPFMAHGHMIPAVNMAKLFASRGGVRSTVVTTPLNVPLLSTKSKSTLDAAGIDVATVPFPSAEVTGLPEGCENLDFITSLRGELDEIVGAFFKATRLLQEPLERLLGEARPDAVVADVFFPWATDSAAKLGVPRLVFHGTGFFCLCASESVRLYEPHKRVSSDSEPFAVPDLPGDIWMARNQLPDFAGETGETGETEEPWFMKLMREAEESEARSFGVVVNSFYELEPAYVDHYREVLKRRAWHVGPVSLLNRNRGDMAVRGGETTVDGHECLNWLDSKKPNSVIYLCFGSVTNFTSDQLLEIAKGLESWGKEFIWVVRRGKTEDRDWLPEGFEDRTAGKGVIIRGWAPQVLILEHEAVGGFVTHCGWNSVLEGVAAGVPMVTWPVAAEQFYNEKLVTEVLRVGVSVGVRRRWVRLVGDFVGSEAVERAVTAVMGSEELRDRAVELAKMARRAVEEGGSSYSDLDKLILELRRRQYLIEKN